MAIATPNPAQPQESGAPIPPLRNGDRLTRAEFERRYEAMPDVRAELLNGVVYMASPVSHRNHSRPQSRMNMWLGFYFIATPGTDIGDNASIKLDGHNEPQPDAFVMVLPSHGGHARMDEEGYIVGAPEWIGEVAASSASYELSVKLPIYRRHGITETLVWRVLDHAFDWFILRGDQYERLALSSEGYFKSEVFPGLWLDPQALAVDDMVEVQAVVQLGLASPEHQQFVERMARQAGECG